MHLLDLYNMHRLDLYNIHRLDFYNMHRLDLYNMHRLDLYNMHRLGRRSMLGYNQVLLRNMLLMYPFDSNHMLWSYLLENSKDR
jgi:hypothetical protein